MTTNNAPAAVDFSNNDSLIAEMKRLMAENAKLIADKAAEKSRGKKGVTVRANPVEVKDGKPTGGNVSVRGLTAKFPFTFYASQSLVMFSPAVVLGVLKAHLGDLANQRMKGETATEQAAERAETKVELERLIGLYSKLEG